MAFTVSDSNSRSMHSYKSVLPSLSVVHSYGFVLFIKLLLSISKVSLLNITILSARMLAPLLTTKELAKNSKVVSLVGESLGSRMLPFKVN